MAKKSKYTKEELAAFDRNAIAHNENYEILEDSVMSNALRKKLRLPPIVKAPKGKARRRPTSREKSEDQMKNRPFGIRMAKGGLVKGPYS